MSKKSNRKRKAEAPKVGGVVLTLAAASTLDKAERLAQGSRRERDEAASLTRSVGRHVRAVVEGEALHARMAEAAHLEEARAADALQVEALAVVTGNQQQLDRRELDQHYAVERSADQETRGRLRMKSRDGLASLYDSRAINLVQLQAGMAFRLYFEKASSGLRSGLNIGTGRGGHRAAERAMELRTEMLLRLNKVELAVNAASKDGRELLALRLVAGEGRCIASFAKGGSVRKSYTDALKRALDAAVTVLRLQAEGAKPSTWSNPDAPRADTVERLEREAHGEAVANQGS